MCQSKCDHDTSRSGGKSQKKQGLGAKGWTALVIGGFIAFSMATTEDPATTAEAAEAPKAVPASANHTELEARCLKAGKAATKQGITGNDRARIMAISAAEAKCKSISNKGLNKDGTEDVCEMQMNKTANADLFKGRNWHNLDDCMWMAKKVLDRQGWQAWSSYNNRSYREFVPMALKLEKELSS